MRLRLYGFRGIEVFRVLALYSSLLAVSAQLRHAPSPFLPFRSSGDLREVVVSGGPDTVAPPKPLDDTERSLSLQVALKCADISNLGRELECYKR